MAKKKESYENMMERLEEIVDVMDGNYVENFGMGLQDIGYICKKSNIDVEAHLMIMNPELHIKKFFELGVDIIYFHPDTSKHPAHVIEQIQNYGMKAGIVLNPESSIEMVSQLFKIADYAMVMCVNPGFSGNKYLPYIEEKIENISKIKDINNIEISIDGGCSKDVITKMSRLGVNRYVLGTTALFGLDRAYNDIFDELRKI